MSRAHYSTLLYSFPTLARFEQGPCICGPEGEKLVIQMDADLPEDVMVLV